MDDNEFVRDVFSLRREFQPPLVKSAQSKDNRKQVSNSHTLDADHGNDKKKSKKNKKKKSKRRNSNGSYSYGQHAGRYDPTRGVDSDGEDGDDDDEEDDGDDTYGQGGGAGCCVPGGACTIM